MANCVFGLFEHLLQMTDKHGLVRKVTTAQVQAERVDLNAAGKTAVAYLHPDGVVADLQAISELL